jgi:hypothetical protein
MHLLSAFAGVQVHGEAWPPFDAGIQHSLIEALLASNARFAAFMLTELFGLEERFNVPGLSSDTNWTARMPMTVAQIRREAQWKDECEWLRDALRRTGRLAASPQ